MEIGFLFILSLIGGFVWLIKRALGTDEQGHDNSAWGKASRRELTPQTELDAAIRDAEISAEYRRHGLRDDYLVSASRRTFAEESKVGGFMDEERPGLQTSRILPDDPSRPLWMREYDEDTDDAAEPRSEIAEREDAPEEPALLNEVAEEDELSPGGVYTPTSVYTSSSYSLYTDGSAPSAEDPEPEQ
jgi:hypothetical protein